jgi:hypothetical protein
MFLRLNRAALLGTVANINRNAGSRLPGLPTERAPAVMATSAVYGSATMFFWDANNPTVPVSLPVVYDPSGMPMIVSSRAFRASWTPESVAVYSPVRDRTFVAHGTMLNPFFYNGFSINSTPQGFDEILTVNFASAQRSAVMDYDPALNVDPGATGTKYLISAGSEGSFVKGIRRGGGDNPIVDPPQAWRHFEEWCVWHVLKELPPLGAFAPAASDLDKTPQIATNMMNMACLGNGFPTPAGMPSLDTVMGRTGGPRYFLPFQPYFGQNGEQRRRMMIDPTGTATNGYASLFAPIWADYKLALLAAGKNVPKEDVYPAISFGVTVRGLRRRGVQSRTNYVHAGGAGQNSGHKMFVMMLVMMFPQVPSIVPDALALHSNATHQPFWPTNDHVGMKTSWPGNHSKLMAPYGEEHLGRVGWYVQSTEGGARPVASDYDSQPDADYQFTSSIAALPEMLAIMLMVKGPNGWNGGQVVAQSVTNLGPTNWRAAALAYADWIASVTDPVYLLAPLLPRHLNAFNALRPNINLPRWGQTPDGFTPWKNTATYLWPVDGGFAWNLTSVGHATEEVIGTQVQYSLDGIGYFDAAPASYTHPKGLTGLQTGLPKSTKLYVRWRRRSASGWGPWSVNFPNKLTSKIANDTADRMTVTTLGVASGVPNNIAPPKLYVKRFPKSRTPWFVAAPAPLDLSNDATLYGSLGMWSGDLTGGPSVLHVRNGQPIADAIASTYEMTTDDVGTMHGFSVAYAAQTATAVPSQIPVLPKLPFGTVIDTSFDSALFKLYYPNTWASMIANSNLGVGSLVIDPSYAAYDEDENILVDAGVLRLNKNGVRPEIRGNVAADAPLTPGTTYDVAIKVPFGIDVPSQQTGQVFMVGSAAGLADIINVVLPDSDQGREYSFARTYTATSSELWISLKQQGSTGSSGGGNPQLSLLTVTKANQPNAFVFETLYDEAQGAVVLSNVVTLQGLLSPTTLRLEGDSSGAYIIDGKPPANVPVIVDNGTKLQLMAKVSQGNGSRTSVIANVNGFRSAWEVRGLVFAPLRVRFDGQEDYLLRTVAAPVTTALTGAVPGKRGTIAMRLQMMDLLSGVSSDSTLAVLFELSRGPSTAANKVAMRIERQATGSVRLTVRDEVGNIKLQRVTAATLRKANGWVTLMASYDLATGANHIYLSDVDAGGAPTTNVGDANVPYDLATHISVMATTNEAAAKTSANLELLWFDPVYVDLTIQSVRNAFLANTLGNGGSGPTGSVPMIYINETAASYMNNAANQGTIGPFETHGTITAA